MQITHNSVPKAKNWSLALNNPVYDFRPQLIAVLGSCVH